MPDAAGVAPAIVSRSWRLQRTRLPIPLADPPAGLERRAHEALDINAMLACLDALVRIPSVGPDEESAQRHMAVQLQDHGMQVDLWHIDMDELRSHPSFCEEVQRQRPLGVVGRLRGGGGGPTLLLNGHVDVVGAGDEDAWSVPPWQLTRDGSRLLGRGVVDMKGGIACALAAIRALQAAGVRLRGDLGFASVVGEEDGGTGTLGLLQRGHRADAALIMEPTRLAVAPAHAGALGFRIRVPGLAAHACVREEGVSAIELLPIVLAALGRLEEERNARLRQALFQEQRLPFALSVGRVRGGDWPSSVPDWVEIEGRYGVAPGESVATARAELEEALRLAAGSHPWMRAHPPQLQWWGGQFEPADIGADHPLVRCTTASLAAASGRPPRVEGMTYGADMRLLVNDGGIPTVMLGPGDVRAAHRTDESAMLEDLLVAARTLIGLALRVCGTAS